jgi:hypothetical protein
LGVSMTPVCGHAIPKGTLLVRLAC